MTMVGLKPTTKRWFFRTTVQSSDGSRHRLHGTPGVPGPYHDLAQTKSGAREAERRAIMRAMNGPPIEAIASAFVAAELERGVSPRTLITELGVLTRLIEFATGEKSNLRQRVNGTGDEIQAVAPADIERLLAACDDDQYRAVIPLASEAGLRAGEICRLEWTDVEDGRLLLRHSFHSAKNRQQSSQREEPRVVPLSPRLAQTLAALPRIGSWIVSRPDGDALDVLTLMRGIGAIYARAGVVRGPMLFRCLRLASHALDHVKKGG